MASNLWTADRRLYLNAEGKVVEADDPTRQSLLVAQGGTIPLADAERYGLVTVTPAQVTTVAPASDGDAGDAGQKAKAASTNKARAPGSNKGTVTPGGPQAAASSGKPLSAADAGDEPPKE